MSKFFIINILILITMTGQIFANGGFYAGGNMGVIVNNEQLKSQQLGFTNPSEKCNINSNFASFFPGMQFGYLYQFSNYLISSIEGNFTFNTTQTDNLSCICPNNNNTYDRFVFKNQMQSAIYGRVGRTLNWKNIFFIPYLTSGASFADIGLKYKNEGGDFYAKNSTQAGWLIGAGIEWLFRKNWSLRAEYTYLDYGNVINLKIPSVYGLIDPNGHAHVTLNSNRFLVAINYWI